MGAVHLIHHRHDQSVLPADCKGKPRCLVQMEIPKCDYPAVEALSVAPP